MTRADYERYKKYGMERRTDVEVVEQIINRLLDNLFCPFDDERSNDGIDGIDFVADPVKVKRFNLGEDAINWGDLGVVEVKKFDGPEEEFHVVIEEAAPGCINLIRYIEKYMNLWGLNVRVKTEW